MVHADHYVQVAALVSWSEYVLAQKFGLNKSICFLSTWGVGAQKGIYLEGSWRLPMEEIVQISNNTHPLPKIFLDGACASKRSP